MSDFDLTRTNLKTNTRADFNAVTGAFLDSYGYDVVACLVSVGPWWVGTGQMDPEEGVEIYTNDGFHYGTIYTYAPLTAEQQLALPINHGGFPRNLLAGEPE